MASATKEGEWIFPFCFVFPLLLLQRQQQLFYLFAAVSSAALVQGCRVLRP